MWQANKWGILALVAGLFAVGAAYFKLQAAGETDLANKVGATGVCAVLFIVGLVTYLMARQGCADDADDSEE